ncbi:MAG: NAD(P)H-dependent oxidoreductase subunit E [Saprospirales bacterium]|nr:NAD(P)H-dependent oxidoreductase subunit E [Saprospirales bacterium]
MMQRWQLLDELWRIQDAHGFLPDGEINALSNKLGISMVELEGVISFYHFFQRKPSGKFTIYLNNSIIADMNGRQAVKEAFEQATNCKWGCVDDTCTFGLFDTSCIGMSDQEPAALINFHPFTNLTPEKVNRIVKQLRWGAPVEELADQVNSEVRFKPDHERTVLLRDFEPGSIVKRLAEMTSDQVLEVLGESKLSGRGGADFPVSLKWRTCRSYETGPKYVVCNADEGEPGTFKDRFLLMNYPGLVFEGMIMAGFVIRAKEGVLYLRGEYKFMKPALEKVLAEYRANSWLGKSVAGIADFDFDIRIQLGAGAYICGEETALLESMEGKRGESRVKIFFPAEKGFLGKPTIINNVETFATAARILELGAPYFNRLGTAKSKGTRLLSISGDCEKPGIYEVEWGITIGQILGLCGAKDTFFMQASGPVGHAAQPHDSMGAQAQLRRCALQRLIHGVRQDALHALYPAQLLRVFQTRVLRGLHPLSRRQFHPQPEDREVSEWFGHPIRYGGHGQLGSDHEDDLPLRPGTHCAQRPGRRHAAVPARVRPTYGKRYFSIGKRL